MDGWNHFDGCDIFLDDANQTLNWGWLRPCANLHGLKLQSNAVLTPLEKRQKSVCKQ
jgi:hypothetical protein